MKRTWILAGAAALALTAVSFNTARAADESDEGNETTMAFKKVPKVVRYTLMREAEGVDIATVDKETEKGKLVYEADVVIDDTNYEILVDPSGLLLSKAIDREDDEPAAKESAKAKKGEDADDEDAKPNAKESGKGGDADDDESSDKAGKGEDAEDSDEKPAVTKTHKAKKSEDTEAEDAGKKAGQAADSDDADDKPAAKSDNHKSSKDSEDEKGDND